MVWSFHWENVAFGNQLFSLLILKQMLYTQYCILAHLNLFHLLCYSQFTGPLLVGWIQFQNLLKIYKKVKVSFHVKLLCTLTIIYQLGFKENIDRGFPKVWCRGAVPHYFFRRTLLCMHSMNFELCTRVLYDCPPINCRYLMYCR